MGGLWSKMRVTAVLMWVGSLALAGMPFFAGYYSKDIILESAFAAHTGLGTYAFWVGIAAAAMTAFYSWRLIFMTFNGPTRADAHTYDHAHESPPVMIAPLIVLALGAIFSGWLGFEYFVGHEMEHFWNGSILMLGEPDIIEAAHHVPEWVPLLPALVGVAGIALAFLFYKMMPTLPARVAGGFGFVYRFVFNKWFFDELYEKIFIRPAFRLGHGLWKGGDGQVIDGVGPDGVAAGVKNLAAGAVRLQTGYLYHYAFAMLIGVVGLVGWYLITVFGGGAG